MRKLWVVGLASLLLSACTERPALVAKSSGSIGISPDDSTLYIADADHDRVTVLDARTETLIAHVQVGRAPERVYVGPEGELFVSNRGDRTVMRIDVDSLAVSAVGHVGAEPVGLTLSPDGERLYVANSLSGTLSVLDARSLEPARDYAVGGTPWSVVVDGAERTAYVTDFSGGSVSLLDLSSGQVTSVVTLEQPGVVECGTPGVISREPAQVADVVLSPDGDRAYVAHVLSRTGREQQWQASLALAVAPALATIDTQTSQLKQDTGDGDFPAAVLTTQVTETCPPGNGMDAPSSLVVDGSGAWIYVADHNSNALAVVSAFRRGTDSFRDPERGIYDVVRVGARPTGVAVTRDLTKAYVHSAFDYDVSVVENRGGRLEVTRRVVFATSPLAPAVDRGRRLFYSAVDSRLTQPELGGLSCSSCHPDGRADGLSWRLPDADAWNTRPARNTPPLWGVLDTAPYHWDGMLADMPAFTSHMVNQMGGSGLGPTEVADLGAYLATVPRPDNPNAEGDAELLARGAALFATSCGGCHAGSAFTDRARHSSIGGELLDTPSLLGAFATKPYLHDGSADSLRAVFQGVSITIPEHDLRGYVTGAEADALERYLRSL